MVRQKSIAMGADEVGPKAARLLHVPYIGGPQIWIAGHWTASFLEAMGQVMSWRRSHVRFLILEGNRPVLIIREVNCWFGYFGLQKHQVDGRESGTYAGGGYDISALGWMRMS